MTNILTGSLKFRMHSRASFTTERLCVFFLANQRGVVNHIPCIMLPHLLPLLPKAPYDSWPSRAVKGLLTPESVAWYLSLT